MHLDYLTEEYRTRLVGRSREDMYNEYLNLPEIMESIWEKKQ